MKVLAICLLGCLFTACHATPVAESLPEMAPVDRVILRAGVDSLLSEMSSAYIAADWERHAVATLELLRRSRLVPIDRLVVTDDVLHEHLASVGMRPLMSYVIDYAYRCRRQDADWSNDCYARLADVFWEEPEGATLVEPVAFVSGIGHPTFHGVSESVALPAADLLFSNFGPWHIANGVTPRGLARLVALTTNCEEREDDDEEDDTAPVVDWKRASVPGCRLLLDLVDEGMDEEQEARFDGDRRSGSTRGLWVGSSLSCMTSPQEEELAEWVRIIEEQQRCAEGGGWNDGGPLGGLMDDGGSADATPPFLVIHIGDGKRTKTKVMGGTVTLIENPEHHAWDDGYQSIFVSDDGLTTVTTDQYADDYIETTKVVIEHGPNGQTTTTVTTTKSVNGKETKKVLTIVENDDGSSTATADHADGARTVTTKNADGSVTVAQYDKEGNLLSEETYPAEQDPASGEDVTPSDEHGDSCLEQTHDFDLGEGGLFGSRGWDPRVAFPAEDEPGVLSPELECLMEMIAGRMDGLSTCPSVVLCLFGVEDDGCTCSPPPGDPTVPHSGSACHATDCPDGEECDPATGQCGGYEGGGDRPVPGVAPWVVSPLNNL
jgi:YD repeat-containing protein